MLKKIRKEIRIIKNILYRRLYINPKDKKNLISEFTKLYYNGFLSGDTWSQTTWMGVRIKKCPCDLMVYQDIIHELKPDVIIECGTSQGGSALYLASLCDFMGNGRVITIDNKAEKIRPAHDRIAYVLGSSIDQHIFDNVKSMIKEGETVMVILDSRHQKYHVDEEIKLYSPLVSKEQYLIVEDTILNGNPIHPKFGPGPMEAVQEFMENNEQFIIDKRREYQYLTWNPNGYLKKIA